MTDTTKIEPDTDKKPCTECASMEHTTSGHYDGGTPIANGHYDGGSAPKN